MRGPGGIGFRVPFGRPLTGGTGSSGGVLCLVVVWEKEHAADGPVAVVVPVKTVISPCEKFSERVSRRGGGAVGAPAERMFDAQAFIVHQDGS